MAAANLQLSSSLISTFEQSQSDNTRWITCTITDVTFEFSTKGKSSGNLEHDLEDVKKVLASTKDGLMVLVCVDEVSKPKKWTIVAYVPETCKIKKRMLFASGRADIKTKLGQSYFKGEIHAIEPSDLTVSNVMRDKTEHEDLPFTFQELALKEDIAASSRPEEHVNETMKTIDFPLTSNMENKIKDFKNGVVDWIECEVTKDEKIECVQSAKIGNIEQSVTKRVDEKQPRFYLVKRCGTAKGDRTYLVFSCPETSPIRLRMVYSTCKASILEQGGIAFDKLLEIRSSDELDDLFKGEEKIDQDAGKIVHQDIVKPRPGGRRGGGKTG
jgi:twinfilin-like protein